MKTMRVEKVGREPMPLGVKLWVLVFGGIATALVAGALFAGCAGPQQAQAAIAEWNTRTVAAMEAEGIAPTDTTDADWKRVGAGVATAMLAESGGAPLPEPEPARDWWEVALGLAGTYFGIKGSVIGVQAASAVLAGKQTRATTNVGTLLSPDTSWPDTLKALAAMALDTHTPTAYTLKPATSIITDGDAS